MKKINTNNTSWIMSLALVLVLLLQAATAFVPLARISSSPVSSSSSSSPRTTFRPLFGEEGNKAGPLVSGEELEMILAELDKPLVIDAYATWCGPCLIMAPEFEAAAKEMEGRVKFVKLDTDKDETMAARLNIMGLPTLLFLDKYEPKEGDENQQAKAVLKGRIEGALRKENIKELCEHYFFGGPAPQLF